ncbi:unknown protein [Oryza sativa Japonica Group]|uniref:Os01g0937300 protein n=2 Tax=Oryza sativa subsp. japonica TaxID=39947 RepID=A0A0P0VCY1_ORYSJ|nr:hypothetical protein OsJ_04698 [Oryza sativa Japonica Group]KAB8085120.1 hypothetical protein EE612_007859 [Oryza sativa]BAD87307.1 unknown protein [Oryza sativa Japonica Group]BAS76119.1 Os01g0937300 [Oryza sativa Japonica Group]
MDRAEHLEPFYPQAEVQWLAAPRFPGVGIVSPIPSGGVILNSVWSSSSRTGRVNPSKMDVL